MGNGERDDVSSRKRCARIIVADGIGGAGISHRGNGALGGVTTVQRINTAGGKLDGACDKAGMLKSVPYSADYVFLRKG
ncbi:DUF3455 domain-containing protein [Bradyrhizobium lablabi]|nr:DUF3455 domain-containing protein [Bradyrhizobium lablabi]